MISAALLVACLAQTPGFLYVQEEAHPRLLHAILAAHVTAQVVDVASTEYAIGSGQFTEANPAMRWAAGRPVRIGIVKGLYAAGSSWYLLKLHRSRPKLEAVLSIASVVVGTVVSARNVRAIEARQK